MISRAFTRPPARRTDLRPTVLLTVLTTVLLTVLATALLTAGPATAGGSATMMSGHVAAVPAAGSGDDDVDDPTGPTLNEFLPAERPLGDCLSSLPKPDCGSEARGGWRQTVVFLAIVAGLAFIAWRVVAASRRARRARPPVTPGTPAATTVPDDAGGDPAP